MIDPDHAPRPYAPLQLPLQIQLLEALWLLWQSLASEGEDALQRGLGLDLRGFMALSYLQERPYQPAELATQLMLQRYETSRLLGQLEEKGLITRVSGAQGDRRRVRVTLTPSGKEAWHQGLHTAEELVQRYLTHFTAPDVQALIRSLKSITPSTGDPR